MPARVQEDADPARPVAAEDDRLLAHGRDEEVARLRDLALVADEEPGAGEDLLQLLPVDLLADEDLAADDAPLDVDQTVEAPRLRIHRHRGPPRGGVPDNSATRARRQTRWRSGRPGSSILAMTTKTPLSEIISLSDLPWQERQPGVRAKSIWEHPETKRRAVLTRLEPGAQLPLHRHVGDELIFVIEGAVSDESGTVTAGTWATARTAACTRCRRRTAPPCWRSSPAASSRSRARPGARPRRSSR